MDKKKIPYVVILIVLIVLSMLLLTVCPRHIDSMYGVKVIGEGNGGIIALYEDKLGGDIYARKIGSDGKAAWGEKDVFPGNSDSKFYNFPFLQVNSDSSGGAIVSWPDSSQDQLRPVSHLARIDSEGNILWQRDFVYFKRIISDGSGGAIIAFDYNFAGADNLGNRRKDLLLVRVDAKGDYPWGLQGVTVPRGNYTSDTLQMAPDGSGGIVVVWEELQRPPEAKPGETNSTGRIYTQKLNSEGKHEWGDGILLYTTPKGIYTESPQITGDGAGGAIVTWHQMYNGRIEDSSPEALMMDILVQKINAGGKVLWQANGLPLAINKAARGAFPLEPRMVSDGSGGAIIIWRDSREDACIYAQRVNTDGTIRWQAGGVKVASTSLNPYPMIVSDEANGAIISYALQEGLNVQKLNDNGETVWPEDGVQVIKGTYQGYSMASEQGSVVIGWGVGKGIFSSEKACVQRVSAEGKVLWSNGIRLNE